MANPVSRQQIDTNKVLSVKKANINTIGMTELIPQIIIVTAL
jgi:hypothetical protein